MTRGLQLASCSADGLLRLWTVRSGECENTFDRHSDKIWAIAVPPEAYYHSATDEPSDNRNDGNDSGNDDEDSSDMERKDNNYAKNNAKNNDKDNDKDSDKAGGVNRGESVDVRRLLLTGGSDSRLLLWQDATREQEGKRLREAEQEILLEQQMQNDLRHKRFGKVTNRGDVYICIYICILVVVASAFFICYCLFTTYVLVPHVFHAHTLLLVAETCDGRF